jgi:transcriptional regulator with XRE-family HTH domain
LQFGDFIKQKREELKLSIREFARRHGYDSGNLSKLERGVLPPPINKKKLDQYARALRVRKGTEDYIRMKQLAEIGCKTYQFRSIFGMDLNKEAEEKLAALVEKINIMGLSERTLDLLNGMTDEVVAPIDRRLRVAVVEPASGSDHALETSV